MEVARAPTLLAVPLGRAAPAWRHAGAAALVGATAAGTALLAGVAARDVVAFAVYQLGWVLLPGLALHRLLDPGARGLERLAVGWALGYAVSISLFQATAALDARRLFLAVPLLALPLLLRRKRAAQTDEAGLPRAAGLGLALVASLGVVFVALSLVPLTPLPGTTTAAYPPDPMFHLSVAAEARNHYPVTDPKASGTPLPYHLFAHYDMAALAQVTGVPLPVSVLRLAFMPLVVLTALAVGLLAALAGAGRLGVPLAAALFLFVGEVDLQPSSLYPFWGGTFFGLTFSPSFLLSVPLFGALLAVLHRLLFSSGRDAGRWVAFALLAWTLGGAKGGSLAVVVGGCLVYAVLRRKLERRALAAAALAGAIAAVQLSVIYQGAGSGGLELRFLGAVRSSSAAEALSQWLAVLGPLGTLLAYAFGVAALLAALVAAAALAPRGRTTWLLYAAVAVISLVPFLAFTHPGESQLYLVQLGLMPVAALGGVALEGVLPGVGRRRPVLAAALAWLGLLVLVAYLPTLTGRDEGALAYGLRYGVALALVAALGVVAALRPRTRARLAVVAVVLAAALNVPLDTLAPLAQAHRSGAPLSRGDDVTPELYDGLSWIRRNTSKDAVLAVNNHDSSRGRFDNFVYSAVAERRVFLEGWIYSIPTVRGDEREAAGGPRMPFPERLRLNDAVFAGDRRAAGVLTARYGVRYLLVDKLHGTGRERVRALGRLVYSGLALDVVALDPE